MGQGKSKKQMEDTYRFCKICIIAFVIWIVVTILLYT